MRRTVEEGGVGASLPVVNERGIREFVPPGSAAHSNGEADGGVAGEPKRMILKHAAPPPSGNNLDVRAIDDTILPGPGWSSMGDGSFVYTGVDREDGVRGK